MRGLRLSRNAALLLYTTQVIFFRVVQCTVFFPRYFAFFFFLAPHRTHTNPQCFFFALYARSGCAAISLKLQVIPICAQSV